MECWRNGVMARFVTTLYQFALRKLVSARPSQKQKDDESHNY
jgi:hypothetical protein